MADTTYQQEKNESKTTSEETILELQNIKKYFPIKAGVIKRKVGDVKAVDDVSLALKKGETFGLVGESGCGKSTTGKIIMRLENPTEGKIIFNDKDITSLRGSKLRNMREDLQMIIKDPIASLNSKMMVSHNVDEPRKNFSKKGHKELMKETKELLEKVGMRREDYYKYPHEFSGGQRQRIGIARALALKPTLIVADEPVSALDVSIQAQVLNLLKELQHEFDLTYLFIAHDLSVVKHMSDRIGVMYLGHIVEIAENNAMYEEPLHPYTQALVSAIPNPDPDVQKERIVLQGDVPNPATQPSTCVFHTRCPFVMDKCKTISPAFEEVRPDRFVACHLYGND